MSVPPRAWVLFERASANFSVGDFNQGNKELDLALAQSPNHPLAKQMSRFRGIGCLEREDYQKAVVEFEEALMKDPEDEIAMVLLSRVRSSCPDEKVRDGKKALELAERVSKLSNLDFADRYELGAAAWAELRDFEAATILQQQVIDLILKEPRCKKNIEVAQKTLELYKRNKPYRERFGGRKSVGKNPIQAASVN